MGYFEGILGQVPPQESALGPAPGPEDRLGAFQKKRALALDRAKKAAFDFISLARAELNAESESGSLGDRVAEGLTQTIQTAKPEDYANLLSHVLSDKKWIAPLEQAVSEYKKLQATPEALEIEADLRKRDVAQLKVGEASRQQGLESIPKEKMFAGGPTQLGELKAREKFLTERSIEAQKKIKTLEAPLPAPEMQGVGTPQLVPEMEGERGFFDNLKDLGLERDHWKESLVKGFDALGLKDDEWTRRVPFDLALRRALDVLDPGRVIAGEILKSTRSEPQEPQKEEKPQEPGGPPSRRQRMDIEVEQKRQRMKQLFGELRERHFMTTWLGVVTFVLLALATKSPVFAAQILLRLSGHDAVDREIGVLERELREDQRRLDDEEMREDRMRSQAAGMILRQDERRQSQEDEVGRIMLRHQLTLREKQANVQDPEDKQLYDRLNKDLRNYAVLASQYARAARDPMTGEIRDRGAEIEYQKYLKKMQGIAELVGEMK